MLRITATETTNFFMAYLLFSTILRMVKNGYIDRENFNLSELLQNFHSFS